MGVVMGRGVDSRDEEVGAFFAFYMIFMMSNILFFQIFYYDWMVDALNTISLNTWFYGDLYVAYEHVAARYFHGMGLVFLFLIELLVYPFLMVSLVYLASLIKYAFKPEAEDSDKEREHDLGMRLFALFMGWVFYFTAPAMMAAASTINP